MRARRTHIGASAVCEDCGKWFDGLEALVAASRHARQTGHSVVGHTSYAVSWIPHSHAVCESRRSRSKSL